MSELSHQDWINKVVTLRFRDRAFIDGKFVAARSGRTFASVNPATGETLAEVASCGEKDIDLAVAAARRSFEAGVWSRTSPSHRKDVLLRLAQLLRENLHELALLEIARHGETGLRRGHHRCPRLGCDLSMVCRSHRQDL